MPYYKSNGTLDNKKLSLLIGSTMNNKEVKKVHV